MWSADGVRLTDCCKATSSYYPSDDGKDILRCNGCRRIVPIGQGDGCERKQPIIEDE